MNQFFMKGSVQMNFWFRFSRIVFKLLVVVSLFLVGAWAGSAIAINWQLLAILAILVTIVLTVVWFVGKFSAYELTDSE